MTRADLIAALEKLDGPFTTPLYSNQQRRDLIALAERAGLTGRELDALDEVLGGSLDAALTLVPKGRYRVYLERLPVDSGPAWKALVRHHGRGHEIEESGHTEHPALCLCIAALKARE